MNLVKRALGVVLLTLLCGSSAWAQENAELKGTVTDPTGAVVPNATRKEKARSGRATMDQLLRTEEYLLLR